MHPTPSVIGLISDTHGLLRPEAIQALQGSELIIHAGDVGDPAILQAFKQIAPVIAVRGNVDTGAWASILPETAVAELGSRRIYILHDLKELAFDPAAAGYQIVISGHSHRAVRLNRSGVEYINPGSAGPRRFRLPVTVARLHLYQTLPLVEFVEIARPG